MPIRIAKTGNLYSAEVTPPQGAWKSPRPMLGDDLARELLSIGCRPLDIADAFRDAGVSSYSGFYHQLAKEMEPRLQAALVEGRELDPKPPFAEAWLAYALLLDAPSPIPLENVIASADSIEHSIPNPDEVAWAFLCLRRRGWLVEERNLYGLTVDGRRAIEEIVGEGGTWIQIDRLKQWIENHPPPRK